MQVLVWAYMFNSFGQISRSLIPESYGKSIFTFVKEKKQKTVKLSSRVTLHWALSQVSWV